MEKESNLRSVIKSITYRLMGTFTTFFISFLLSGQFCLSFKIAGIEVFVKMFTYYIHERLWQIKKKPPNKELSGKV